MIDRTLSFISDAEEHGAQFSSKRRAAIAARIESQRSHIKHTHYLTTTWRDLTERLCWTIVPTKTAISRLCA